MIQAHETAHLHCVHSDDPQTIDERIKMAAAYCHHNGVRFTALRRQVFRIILQADKPLGAYDVLGELQQNRTNQTSTQQRQAVEGNNHVDKQQEAKPIAPPTVYRTLEFLLAQGFIHQLTSINAFIPCCHPRDEHVAAFLICENCGQVQECSSDLVQEVIGFAQQSMGFAVKNAVMELSGICKRCREVLDPIIDGMDYKPCT